MKKIEKEDINLDIFIKFCIFHITHNTAAVGLSNFRSYYYYYFFLSYGNAIYKGLKTIWIVIHCCSELNVLRFNLPSGLINVTFQLI